MKKILGMMIVLVVAVSSTVFAETTTTNPATQPNPAATTPTTPTAATKKYEDQAREICNKKGLAGKWLDECVQAEVAKLSATTTNK